MSTASVLVATAVAWCSIVQAVTIRIDKGVAHAVAVAIDKSAVPVHPLTTSASLLTSTTPILIACAVTRCSVIYTVAVGVNPVVADAIAIKVATIET